ncbi:ABC transporter transmembrane region 2-domain-containing protein [Chytriomyces cf. hyalinus JEL632]|nr:ABC transporter transmembrane region 2-domain-containing protein [Chytriomyces cf. hyalinus JEL632]
MASANRSAFKVGGAAVCAIGAVVAYVRFAQSRKDKTAQSLVQKEKTPLRVDKNIVKVGVDARFMHQLRYILKIAVPQWHSKTVAIVALHTCFLVLRTWLSVVVARIDGMIVRDLISSNAKAFARSLGFWFLIAIPATYTNSMIKYLQSKLAISLRTKMTQHIHKIYLEKKTYYKAINLDNRIDGVDQLITTDVNKFCDSLASLYSNLGKPILDLIIFNYQLSRSIGPKGTLALAVNYCVTASLLRALTPAFGKMAAVEAKLEGDFRAAHSRVITNAEEIAFYHGGALERGVLDRAYLNLVKHLNRVYGIRIAYNMFEDMIIKYGWSAVGLLISSIPVFYPEYAGSDTKAREAAIEAQEARERDHRKFMQESGDGTSLDSISINSSVVDRKTGSRTQGFITNKKFLISLADAGGRIMYSYKELSELAGYTYRVYTLLRVLDDLHEDMYIKMGEHEAEYTLEKIDGTVQYGYSGIKFTDVPVVTPSGDTLLVRDLSFNIGPGDHLMITGPNGSGKTSVARLLSGLWPLFKGRVNRPTASLSEIMYIPQRPYLPIGSLRQQIIYPHTEDDMEDAGKTDEDLFKILKVVYLDYIPGREGGLDSIKEWKDVFSGGEKQRMQLARIFYHNPRFVVLDEATSAVSTDVEALLYNSAKEYRMTVVTISHRPTLFKYHAYLLRLGEGADGDEWNFEKISGEGADHDKLLKSVDTEIRKIENQLAGADGMRKRLDEINRALQITNNSEPSDDSLRHAKRTLI